MRRLFLFSAIAMLAVAGFCFVSSVRAEDPVKGAVNTNPIPAKDAEGIRDTIASITEAAVTKGGFDDVVERFVDADRNRLGKSGITEKDQPMLDGRIDQFLKDWKAKYNQDFDIKDEDAVYNASFAMIREGEIPEGARTAGEKVGGGDTNREPGRNVAVVTIPGKMGKPDLVIPMIHEMPDAWKIDLPDNITAEQLRDNLLKHITMIDEDKANWPADVNDAYRAVTCHVLAGVMNVEKSMDHMPKDHSDRTR